MIHADLGEDIPGRGTASVKAPRPQHLQGKEVAIVAGEQ